MIEVKFSVDQEFEIFSLKELKIPSSLISYKILDAGKATISENGNSATYQLDVEIGFSLSKSIEINMEASGCMIRARKNNSEVDFKSKPMNEAKAKISEKYKGYEIID